MSNETVLELSVEETNKLRASLGLAPLRDTNAPPASSASAPSSTSDQKEVLSLSVQETNDLRAQLGLAPLRTETANTVVHKPAENVGATKEAAARIQEAAAKRAYQASLQEWTKPEHSLTKAPEETLSWAQQMRARKATKQEKNKPEKESSQEKDQEYNATDLTGLYVSHALDEFQAGESTVLTLKDAPLLQTREDHTIVGLAADNDDEDAQAVELENVTLTDQQTRQQGLKEKRKMELGMGRAGGYAGFDDDEFELYDGSTATGPLRRGEAPQRSRPRGFAIGTKLEQEEEDRESDLFAGNRAISLEPSKADAIASDFLTAEEVRASKPIKPAKFKKKKKDKKKDKKRRKAADDDEEDDDDPVATKPPLSSSKGLLEELEATAVESTSVRRKRRRSEEEEDDESASPTKESNEDRRAKFDAIMQKGNERTRQAFQPTIAPKKMEANEDDEEPDDAFLHAALAKARRLNRLRALDTNNNKVKGADAVAQAVQSSQVVVKQEKDNTAGDTAADGTITFSVDETREFTRALQARTEQTQRKVKEEAPKQQQDESKVKVEEVVDMEEMEELAKEIEEPVAASSTVALDGSTAASAPVGRGLASFLSVLKQTGEITKHAAKEEMRGRAKDKRTYEDYEEMDLNKVVQIDRSKATGKDLELAEREVKLEYRDKFGRLLTRKEAFRELSYQFHGKGSGLKKQEKKMKQIAQEQAQARIASKQAGSFGAQKATQKATGKAFIVHKTS